MSIKTNRAVIVDLSAMLDLRSRRRLCGVGFSSFDEFFDQFVIHPARLDDTIVINQKDRWPGGHVPL